MTFNSIAKTCMLYSFEDPVKLNVLASKKATIAINISQQRESFLTGLFFEMKAATQRERKIQSA